MRNTGKYILLGITIAVTLYVFAGIIYFRPQTWDKVLTVVPAVAEVPVQAPVAKPEAVPTVTPEVVPAEKPVVKVIPVAEEQIVDLDKDLMPLDSIDIDTMADTVIRDALAEADLQRDLAIAKDEEILPAIPLVPSAPKVTMTVKPIVRPVPVVDEIEKEEAPVAEEPAVPGPPITEMIVEPVTTVEPDVLEVIVDEKIVAPTVPGPPIIEIVVKPVTVEPEIPEAPVAVMTVEPVAPAPIMIPAPPIVSMSIRPIPAPIVTEEEIVFLWTPTVMPEGPPIYMDPISFNEKAFELRRKAVDEILDKLIFE